MKQSAEVFSLVQAQLPADVVPQAGQGLQLIGTAPVPIPAGVRGAVQFIAPNGATAQPRF